MRRTKEWWQRGLNKEDVESTQPIWKTVLDSDPDSYEKLRKESYKKGKGKKVRKIWCDTCGKLSYRKQVRHHSNQAAKNCIPCVEDSYFGVNIKNHAVLARMKKERELIEQFIKEEKERGRPILEL